MELAWQEIELSNMRYRFNLILCKDIGFRFEAAINVMVSLSDLLFESKDLENGNRLAAEMQKAKGDFEAM